jgi:hypothetical protein
MNVAKLSVSLDPTRIKFIEQYQTHHKVRTKSEVVDRALELLQIEELKLQYAAAYQEWHDAGEAENWDSVAWKLSQTGNCLPKRKIRGKSETRRNICS